MVCSTFSSCVSLFLCLRSFDQILSHAGNVEKGFFAVHKDAGLVQVSDSSHLMANHFMQGAKGSVICILG